jgi:hypothetical protein
LRASIEASPGVAPWRGLNRAHPFVQNYGDISMKIRIVRSLKGVCPVCQRLSLSWPEVIPK